eukprot:GDKJ01048529.1.p1 GENE.GDKJ01048529.1~~GDKJ01048529.1.p1  ORF type:complete len:852 (+),score=120.53 GDKJ01048529.1:26-2557(+)
MKLLLYSSFLIHVRGISEKIIKELSDKISQTCTESKFLSKDVLTEYEIFEDSTDFLSLKHQQDGLSSFFVDRDESIHFIRPTYCDVQNLHDLDCLTKFLCPVDTDSSSITIDIDELKESNRRAYDFTVTESEVTASALMLARQRAAIISKNSESSTSDFLLRSSSDEEVDFLDFLEKEISSFQSSQSTLRERRLTSSFDYKQFKASLSLKINALPPKTFKMFTYPQDNAIRSAVALVRLLVNYNKNFSDVDILKKLDVFPTSFDPRTDAKHSSVPTLTKCFQKSLVLDQKNCGSCWAYAAAHQMSIAACAANDGNPISASGSLVMHTVSPKTVLDCYNLKTAAGKTSNTACSGGPLTLLVPQDNLNFLPLAVESRDSRHCGDEYWDDRLKNKNKRQNEKICTSLKDVHPSMYDCGCFDMPAFKDGKFEECKKHPNSRFVVKKSFTLNHISLNSDAIIWKALVYTYGAIKVTIRAPSSFILKVKGDIGYAHGKIVSTGPHENIGSGTHASHGVVIVGWDVDVEGKLFWILLNSWGSSWGADGYYHLYHDDRLLVTFQGILVSFNEVEILPNKMWSVPSLSMPKSTRVMFDPNQIYFKLPSGEMAFRITNHDHPSHKVGPSEKYTSVIVPLQNGDDVYFPMFNDAHKDFLVQPYGDIREVTLLHTERADMPYTAKIQLPFLVPAESAFFGNTLQTYRKKKSKSYFLNFPHWSFDEFCNEDGTLLPNIELDESWTAKGKPPGESPVSLIHMKLCRRVANLLNKQQTIEEWYAERIKLLSGRSYDALRIDRDNKWKCGLYDFTKEMFVARVAYPNKPPPYQKQYDDENGSKNEGKESDESKCFGRNT